MNEKEMNEKEMNEKHIENDIENDWCYVESQSQSEDTDDVIKVTMTSHNLNECPNEYESFSTQKNTYYIESVLFKSNVSRIYLVHTHNENHNENHNNGISENTTDNFKNCKDCRKFIIKKYHKESIKQAKNEYKILKKLNSKYIISIVDKDLKNGILVMNKYSQDMFDLLVTCQATAKKLSTHSLKKYVTELINALFYLHTNDVAHFDIKPENVLLTNDHHVIFIDFGFAKRMKSNKAYEAKGTPFYAAPELSDHEQGFDAFKADVWALGMTIFLLLERRRPFNLDNLQDKSDVTIDKVWKLINSEELVFFSKSDFYREYHYLISKMLAKNPKKRWNIYEVKAENDKINKKYVDLHITF